MPFNNNITPGRPPVLWSEVNEAFTKVNENFDILVATIGTGSGLAPIDFSSLDTDVTPTTNNLRSLGDITRQWRSVFTAEHTTVDPLNGLWAGSAQVKGVGSIINLPTGSTVGGDPLTGVGTSLIIDPDKTFFKEIQINNDLSIVATTFGDTVNFLSGSGVGLAVSSGADSITFSNTGILSVAAGSGISTATGSGVATITNTGVRSLQNVTALPSGRTTGAGININGATGDNLRITNTGVITVSSGVGITVSTDIATGDVTITNSAPAVNAFTQIVVNNDIANILAADAASDTLNIASDATITLSKNVATDTLTIAVNPVFDLRGSVFGDDSTKIIDAVENKVYGGIFATTLRTEDTKIALGIGAGGDGLQGLDSVAIGIVAGGFNQGDYAVAIGSGAGNVNQGNRAVAIGAAAGAGQGDYAISIGNGAGYPSAVSGSIAINASGFTLDAPAAGFYVNPVRNQTGASGIVQYDSSTKEVTYNSALGSVSGTLSGTFTGNIFTSLIDSADSSAITVTPKTIFSSDVNVENELTVSNGITFSDGSVLKSYSPVTVIAATTTTQTVNDGASASFIQFVDTVDTANSYSTGTFTVPYTGYYQINMSVYFSTTVTLNPGSFLTIDTNLDGTKQVVIFNGSWTGSYLHYSTVIPASAGDAIRVAIRQVSGGPIDISSSSRLAIHRVSIGA
jgi:hypothetical protein